MAAVTSGLLAIVKTGITIVSYLADVTASLFAVTIVRKFTQFTVIQNNTDLS